MKNSNQKFTVSSAKNPCPICDRTKDADCHFNDEIILCHSDVDCDARKDGYIHRGATDDGMWGQYFPVIETIQKVVRIKATKDFFYPNLDRSPLVKVTRKDDGEGKKTFSQSHWNGQLWVYGLTDEVKSNIHLYRIFDPINQSAISRNQHIFIVEGEGLVDMLIDLQIPATTSIGGAGKWKSYGYPNYVSDLKGSQPVICPDLDRKGLLHSESIAEDFPHAKWCYAFPELPSWECIPDNGGLDHFDWVKDLRREGLSTDQVRDRILKAVELRRELRQKNSDKFEKYLSELQRLSEICDPIKKGFEISEFSKTGAYPLRQLESALGHLKQRQGSKVKTIFELDEFLSLPLTATPWIVPGLIPSGETILLAGLPKEGKSLIGYDLAYAIATNRDLFLGEQAVFKGRVLMILSDESPRSGQGRLIKRGFTAEDTGQVRIITRFNLQNLPDLENQLADFQPCLTIIDSLKSITQGSEVSENSAEFGDAIYALKEMLTKHDSAGILIHHSNKDKDAQGVAQVRGSTAIAGAVWGCWVLKTPRQRQGEERPKDRWLEINPREGERKTLSIGLDPICNNWKLIGSTGQLSPEQATTKDRVVALLKGLNGKGLEFSELKDLLPDIKPKTLTSTLNRLVDSGIASKRPSTTNPKEKVYFMDSPMDSDGFIPVENEDSPMDSLDFFEGDESKCEFNKKFFISRNSADGFKVNAPRGRQGESMVDSRLDSGGFMNLDEEVEDCEDL
jgi:hypothetical protein